MSKSAVSEVGPRFSLATVALDPTFTVTDGFHLVFVRGYAHPDDGRVRLMSDGSQGLEVEERAGGSVPVLVARNPTDTPILILAGQLIRGGKQNRGVNADALVPAKGATEIPVTCVEQGRWSGLPTGAFVPEGFEPHFLRAQKMRDLHRWRETVVQEIASIGDRGIGAGHGADQRAVWRSIEEFRFLVACRSDSTDLLASLRETEGNGIHRERLEAARAEARSSDGVLVFIDGELVAGDLFGVAGWFDSISDELLHAAMSSYLFARSRRGQAVPCEGHRISLAAGSILDGLELGHWERHRPLGDEQSWRIDHPFVDAAVTLAPDGLPLHLQVSNRRGNSAFRRPDFRSR